MDGESLFICKKIKLQKLAIIGTGIAGMGCAHLLQHKYDLTMFEQNDYIGGHTNTITVKEGNEIIYIDTGFMVFNFQTYPHLCKLFENINAPIKKTNMSFSVQHTESGLEYCGSGFNGLFAQRKNIFNLKFIKMLKQIARFNKESIEVLDNPHYEDFSIEQYIKQKKYNDDMLWKYLIPMSSAVWSSPMEDMLKFPIVSLVRFFKNHGFLGLNSQHQWYTLQNGSQAYRELLIEPFRNRIQINNAVKRVKMNGKKVMVHLANGKEQEFDKVIFASHADQTIRMIENPTSEQFRILSSFRYQKNNAIIHTDESVMPKNRKVWSSWNYKTENVNGKNIPTTIYWMNNLQQVSKKKNYFVSINPFENSIDSNKIIREIHYEHPLFDIDAMKAQKELSQLNKNDTLYFCGSYFNYGFHEDAFESAVSLCENL